MSSNLIFVGIYVPCSTSFMRVMGVGVAECRLFSLPLFNVRHIVFFGSEFETIFLLLQVIKIRKCELFWHVWFLDRC